MQAAARNLGLQSELLDVRSRNDLDMAFAHAVERHVDALIVGADGLTQVYQRLIIDSVARYSPRTDCLRDQLGIS
jgi:hypothetical protein